VILRFVYTDGQARLDDAVRKRGSSPGELNAALATCRAAFASRPLENKELSRMQTARSRKKKGLPQQFNAGSDLVDSAVRLIEGCLPFALRLWEHITRSVFVTVLRRRFKKVGSTPNYSLNSRYERIVISGQLTIRFLSIQKFFALDSYRGIPTR
jgi:hypothetical protein